LAIVGSLMNEEATKERFEELEKTIEEHKKLLDGLKADFKLLVRHSPIAKSDLISTAIELGNPSFDQVEVNKCREFLEKYGILEK
jgi:hypothetical protein